MAKTSELTPMLRHYLETKAQNPDAILMYRMGDFFELFFEDAVEAAPILEVTLTARQKGTANETPMCGVPHHAVEGYIAKLIEHGYKVAICDQVEEPSQAKGLVKREVTRIVTPGTLSDPLLMDADKSNLLVAVEWQETAGAGAFLEVSTGDFFVVCWSSFDEMLEDLGLYEPSELLVAQPELLGRLNGWVESRGICVTQLDEGRRLDGPAATDLLQQHFEVASLRGFGLQGSEVGTVAAANALAYALDTQRSELEHVSGLRVRPEARRLVLDTATLANLEIFANARDGGTRGTLLSVVDLTRTAAGGRLLKGWLREPLLETCAIEARLDAVGELLEGIEIRREQRESLAGVGDVERLLARAVLGKLSPREAGTLRSTLVAAPGLLEPLAGSHSELLSGLATVGVASELLSVLERELAVEPPASFKHGGVIAAGVDEELDECRSLANDSKKHVAAVQARERERTGIGSLKVSFNKVFGYYLEVTKANLEAVPEDYIRKQTLVNAERFITPELKELEERILTAEQRQFELEAERFEALQRQVVASRDALLALGRCLATLDVLTTFAELSERNRYTRPAIAGPGEAIDIQDGRHPVVERLGREAFVPNDVLLESEASRIVVLTGPNMGGKSTYLRQVALIVLMAQVGSFVPAASASIGVVDRIFTRVGASDDLTRGESTFMVEMIETSNILRYATGDSLVILDEVGRGTATFDGLSLAWAIVEYLDTESRAKTLFATHYHELTELAALHTGIVNRTMLVKEWEDRIVFLRRVVPGSADKSYGIHVARLAGLPAAVLERAADLLENLESHEYDMTGRPRIARGPSPGEEADQLNLFAASEDVVASVIREVDVQQLTPLAALNLLHSLKSRLTGSS
jgi:DNA mismatch repair protein MutS